MKTHVRRVYILMKLNTMKEENGYIEKNQQLREQ